MADKKEQKVAEMKNQAEESKEKKQVDDAQENTVIDEMDAESSNGEMPEDGEEKEDGSEDAPKTLEEQIALSNAALTDANDRVLRISAEFENYKKRINREMEEFKKYSNEALIKQLLNVIDNLERAIESSKTQDASVKSIAEGVEMTHKEILSVLEKFNLKTIDCVEKPFDPEFHQAVSQEETDALPDNTVLRELMKGYTLHDRLIRPSMVVVSKKAAEKKEKKKINEKV